MGDEWGIVIGSACLSVFLWSLVPIIAGSLLGMMIVLARIMVNGSVQVKKNVGKL
jgi:hypothetical protein